MQILSRLVLSACLLLPFAADAQERIVLVSNKVGPGFHWNDTGDVFDDPIYFFGFQLKTVNPMHSLGRNLYLMHSYTVGTHTGYGIGLTGARRYLVVALSAGGYLLGPPFLERPVPSVGGELDIILMPLDFLGVGCSGYANSENLGFTVSVVVRHRLRGQKK